MNKENEKSAVDKVLEPMREKHKEEVRKERKKVLEFYKANIFRDIFLIIGVITIFTLVIDFFGPGAKTPLTFVFSASVFLIVLYLIKVFRDIKNPFRFYELDKIEEKDSEFILKDNLSRRTEAHKRFIGGLFFVAVILLFPFLVKSLVDLFF